MKTLFPLAFSLFLLNGCVYSEYTQLITPAIAPFKVFEDSVVETDIEHIKRSSLDAKLEEQSSTIGDIMFTVVREDKTVTTTTTISKDHLPPYKTPISQQLPINSYWKAAYIYDDGDSGELLVYTSLNFFQEQIGVILDETYVPATDESLVQVTGMKSGRRWPLLCSTI